MNTACAMFGALLSLAAGCHAQDRAQDAARDEQVELTPIANRICLAHAPRSGTYRLPTSREHQAEHLEVAVVDSCIAITRTQELQQTRLRDPETIEWSVTYLASGRSFGSLLRVRSGRLALYSFDRSPRPTPGRMREVSLGGFDRAEAIQAATASERRALLTHVNYKVRAAALERLLVDQADPRTCAAFRAVLDEASGPASRDRHILRLVQEAHAPCLMPSLRARVFDDAWARDVAPALAPMLAPRECGALLVEFLQRQLARPNSDARRVLDAGLIAQVGDALIPRGPGQCAPGAAQACLSEAERQRFLSALRATTAAQRLDPDVASSIAGLISRVEES